MTSDIRVVRTFVARIVFCAIAVSATAPVALLPAQNMEIPIATQIPLFLKVIAFDRRIEINPANTLIIVVAFQSGFRQSTLAKDEVARVLAGLPAGERRAIRIVTVDLDRGNLRATLRDLHATMLYVTPLRGLAVSEITTVARAALVTTFTGVPKYIEQGIAVGVRRLGDRPKLMVNLRMARLHGADFSAEFLKLVEVVE